MMRLAYRAIIAAVVCVLAGAASAAAADYCILLNSSGTMVLKGFAPPSSGVCKELRGFMLGGQWWTSGTACGSSDGENITFAVTQFHFSGSAIVSDFFKLSRASPTTPVIGSECWVVGFEGCSSTTYAKTTCVPSTMPVPQ